MATGPEGRDAPAFDETLEERERYKEFIRATEAYIADLHSENARLKSQIEATARQDHLHRPFFVMDDFQLELMREREKNLQMVNDCREIKILLREAQVSLRETMVELKETQSQLRETQSENQKLKEALTARPPQSGDTAGGKNHALPSHPHVDASRRGAVHPHKEQAQGENKAMELSQLFLEQLTKMDYAASQKGSTAYATFSHQATGFSFKLEECIEPPNLSGGEKVLRYKPGSLGTLRKIAPPWMRDELLVDVEQMPMLLRRLLWVAGGRYFNQPFVL